MQHYLERKLREIKRPPSFCTHRKHFEERVISIDLRRLSRCRVTVRQHHVGFRNVPLPVFRLLSRDGDLEETNLGMFGHQMNLRFRGLSPARSAAFRYRPTTEALGLVDQPCHLFKLVVCFSHVHQFASRKHEDAHVFGAGREGNNVLSLDHPLRRGDRASLDDGDLSYFDGLRNQATSRSAVLACNPQILCQSRHYRHRGCERRGGRVINSATAKPMPPAISSEPSGFSWTLFAIACEASPNASPPFSYESLA